MLKICLGFWKSEPQYAYKRYAYKKNMYVEFGAWYEEVFFKCFFDPAKQHLPSQTLIKNQVIPP